MGNYDLTRAYRLTSATSLILAVAALLLTIARPQPQCTACLSARPRVKNASSEDAAAEERAPVQADLYGDHYLAACLRVKGQHRDIR